MQYIYNYIHQQFGFSRPELKKKQSKKMLHDGETNVWISVTIGSPKNTIRCAMLRSRRVPTIKMVIPSTLRHTICGLIAACILSARFTAKIKYNRIVFQQQNKKEQNDVEKRE